MKLVLMQFCSLKRLVRSFVALGVLGLVSVTAGCGGEDGPPTAHLQGTVTLGGKPIPADATAYIFFNPLTKEQGKAATAAIVNGKYDCPSAPVGSVKVMFNITQPKGPEYEERGVKVRSMVTITPPSAASGIDLQVDGDKSDANFDLVETN
jgi:hypothetical protein